MCAPESLETDVCIPEFMPVCVHMHLHLSSLSALGMWLL